MFSGLKYFNTIAGGKVTDQFLIYGGKTTQKRTDFQVLPWLNVR